MFLVCHADTCMLAWHPLYVLHHSCCCCSSMLCLISYSEPSTLLAKHATSYCSSQCFAFCTLPDGCALTGIKRRVKGQSVMRGHGGTGVRAKKTGWPMQQRPGCWVWPADQVVVLVLAVGMIHQIGISGVISLAATAGEACRYLQKERKDYIPRHDEMEANA